MTIGINKELLKGWRKDALISFDASVYEGTASALATAMKTAEYRILRLTQVLLDQYLLQEEGKEGGDQVE